jgi:hypothetical protein
MKPLSSLFVLFFFVVLSRSYISGNRLVKLTIVDLDLFSQFFNNYFYNFIIRR